MALSRAERMARVIRSVADVTYCRIVARDGTVLATDGDLDDLSKPALADDLDIDGFWERDLHPHVAARGKTRGVYLFVDEDTFVQMFFDFDGDVGDFYQRSQSLASLAYQINAELMGL